MSPPGSKVLITDYYNNFRMRVSLATKNMKQAQSSDWHHYRVHHLGGCVFPSHEHAQEVG